MNKYKGSVLSIQLVQTMPIIFPPKNNRADNVKLKAAELPAFNLRGEVFQGVSQKCYGRLSALACPIHFKTWGVVRGIREFVMKPPAMRVFAKVVRKVLNEKEES
jgi:hypothetical protein